MNIDNLFSQRILNLDNEGNISLSSQENSDYKSFSEEFAATKHELSSENSSKNLKDKEKLNALYVAGNFPMTNNHSIFNLNFNGDLTTKNSSSCKSYKIDFKTVKSNDIDFLQKLTQKNDIYIHSTQNDYHQNSTVSNNDTGVSYVSSDFSKGLNNLIDYAYTTKRPVRIDFEKDTSVIIKIDKAGKVSAEFIPGDKAVELAIKNALPELKSKFDSENLPYNELTSRSYNDQQERRNKQKEGDKNE